MKNEYFKKGISLIVLVITIIVIIILAGSVILNLVNSNTIVKVNEANFKMGADTLKSALSLRVLADTASSGNMDYTNINGSPSSILGSQYLQYDTKYIIKAGILYLTNIASSQEYNYAKSMDINMRVNLNNLLLNADFSQINPDGLTPKFWDLEFYNGNLTCRTQNGKMYAKGVGVYITANVFGQYRGYRNFTKDDIYYFRVMECTTSWDTIHKIWLMV